MKRAGERRGEEREEGKEMGEMGGREASGRGRRAEERRGGVQRWEGEAGRGRREGRKERKLGVQ